MIQIFVLRAPFIYVHTYICIYVYSHTYIDRCIDRHR